MNEVQNERSALARTAALGGIGAAAGAVGGGACQYFKQRAILSKPDEYLIKLAGEIAHEKSMNTPDFKGTKEAADLANKKLDDFFNRVKEFAEKGKYDYKKIAKSAGYSALIVGGVLAGVYGIYRLGLHFLRIRARVVAEGFHDAEKKKAQ